MPVQRLVPRRRAKLYSAINTGHYRRCLLKGPRDFLAGRKGTEIKPSGSLCSARSAPAIQAGARELCAGCSLSCNHSRREARAPRHCSDSLTAHSCQGSQHTAWSGRDLHSLPRQQTL